MRYERSVAPAAPRPERAVVNQRAPARRRRNRLAALGVGVATAGVVAGVLVAGTSSGVSGASRVQPSVIESAKATFLAVNTLTENIGAPPPLHEPAIGWILRGVAIARAGTPGARLARAEHNWVGADGRYVGLTGGQARMLSQRQRADISTVATGDLRRQLFAELAQVVAGETGRSTTVSSPGGASIEQWEGLDVTASSARLEALIAIWEQKDDVVQVGTRGRARLRTSLFEGQVNAVATMVRRNGRWFVSSLSQAPYPQPT